MDQLLIAILAGLGGMFGWGLADLFAKKTIDAIGDIVTLVVAHIFGTCVVILIALYSVFVRGQTLVVPQDLETWLLLAFFGILQGLVYLLVYRGFGKGQVAVLNPVFSSFSGLTAIFSVAFFAEILTGNLIVALSVVFVGIMLMNLDVEALRARRLDFIRVPGFFEIGIATLLAAFWTLGWNWFVSGADWLSYALYMYLFMTLALLVYAYANNISLRITKPEAWIYLALIGLTETLAYIAISWGYGATQMTSVVAVLSGAFSLPTMIGARLWLKERTTRLQLIGSIVIVVGVGIIALI